MTKTIASILSLLAILLSASLAQAQFTETKDVSKYQAFDPKGVLNIENRYGNITVRSWQADSIRITAQIMISSKSRDRLAQLQKRSQVEMYITNDFADVKTVVDESTLAKEWRNIKNLASSGGDQIEVNYVVDVPTGIKLEITNRFGNTYIHKHNGRIMLDSEHGDVRLGTTPNLERAEVSFGKLYARVLNKSDLDLAFCDLDIDKASTLKIRSKSSTIHLGELKNVYVQSARDKIKIGKAKLVKVSGSLTKVEIEELQDQLDVNLKYGKLWVQQVKPSFSTLRIMPKHCTVYMNFENKDKVKTVIKGADISIDYDKGMGDLKKAGYQYEGYLGSVPAEGKSLYISGEKSSFTIDFEKN